MSERVAADEDLVFLRPGRGLVVVLLTTVWIVVVFGIVDGATSSSQVSVPVLLVDGALLAICIGASVDALLCSVRLTAEGIERRRLLFRRSVPWSDVASASMETGRTRRKPVVLLTTKDGQVSRLLEVQPARLRALPSEVDPENALLVRLVNERVGAPPPPPVEP